MKALILFSLLALGSNAVAQENEIYSQCQERITQQDTYVAKTTLAIDQYQELVAAHKSEAATLAASRQMALVGKIYNVYARNPGLRAYSKAIAQAANSPKQAALAELLRQDIFNGYSNSRTAASIAKQVEALKATGVDVQAENHSTDISVSEKQSVGGLEMSLGAYGSLHLVDKKIVLEISLSIVSRNAPVTNGQSRGVTYIELATGTRLKSVKGDVRWSGGESSLLSEPFTDWEEFVSTYEIADESESARLCRTLLN